MRCLCRPCLSYLFVYTLLKLPVVCVDLLGFICCFCRPCWSYLLFIWTLLELYVVCVELVGVICCLFGPCWSFLKEWSTDPEGSKRYF